MRSAVSRLCLVIPFYNEELRRDVRRSAFLGASRARRYAWSPLHSDAPARLAEIARHYRTECWCDCRPRGRGGGDRHAAPHAWKRSAGWATGTRTAAPRRTWRCIGSPPAAGRALAWGCAESEGARSLTPRGIIRGACRHRPAWCWHAVTTRRRREAGGGGRVAEALRRAVREPVDLRRGLLARLGIRSEDEMPPPQ